jgi:glyoxylase-like metal-dependent hydrolase (beta-lactamase superfamily II)
MLPLDVQTEREAPVHRAAPLLVLVGLILSPPVTIARQRLPEPPFALNVIGPRVWAAIDNPNAQSSSSGANAGFVIGDDGVAVIDTFANVEAAKQLLADIRTVTNLPIKFVINTHHHADHVTGNRIFVDAGAVVIAQRNVRTWIQAAFVPPAVVYDESLDLFLGSRELQIRSFPGHTGGDSVVLIPDAHIAFTGDLFWQHNVPNTVDASTQAWIDTLHTLVTNDAGYTFVPGHGDVGKAQDVTVFRDYLVTLRQWVADAQAEGKSAAAVIETVMPRLTAQYGQWEYFAYVARTNVLEMDAELRGTKKIPQAAPAK